MKKIIIVLFLALVLCSCKQEYQGNALLSDEITNVFYKIDGKELTNNDIFQNLKSQQASQYAENEVAKQLLDKEKYDFEEDKKNIEETFNLYAQYYGGEESLLSAYGCETIEEYIEMQLKNSYTTIYLLSYIKNNINDYDSKYKGKYIEYTSSSDEKAITKFQKSITKTNTFEKAFEKQKFENNEQIQTELYSAESSTLPNEVKTVLESLTSEEKCSDIIKVETTTEPAEEGQEPTTTVTYYVIHVLSDKPSEDYLSEYASFIKEKESLNSLVQVIDGKHTLEFYDEDFKYVFDKLNSTYLKAEEDNTEE